jgi:hypothetical protein
MGGEEQRQAHGATDGHDLGNCARALAPLSASAAGTAAGCLVAAAAANTLE